MRQKTNGEKRKCTNPVQLWCVQCFENFCIFMCLDLVSECQQSSMSLFQILYERERERGGQTDRQRQRGRDRQRDREKLLIFLSVKQPAFLHRELASEDQNVD